MVKISFCVLLVKYARLRRGDVTAIMTVGTDLMNEIVRTKSFSMMLVTRSQNSNTIKHPSHHST